MITAIIVNYHSHLLTVRAAASVLDDQPDAQVIVIDNSEDEAEAHALSVALPPRVECIISPQNIGFGRACNLGYDCARHDWILLLNPDALVLGGCIRALVEFMEQTPQAGAAAPLCYWDEAQTWLLPPGQLPTPVTELGMALALRWPWLGRFVSQRFRRWSLECLTSGQPVAQKMLSGGHILLRHSAVVAAGGLFDSDFFMYYEDTDLCMRLQRAAFKLYLVPAARAMHAWLAAPGKATLSQISRQQYFQKQFPGSPFIAIREYLGRHGLVIQPLESKNLGICAMPPVFPVSSSLRSAWVLELSPHPLLVPALYTFGRGDTCQLSDKIWNLLGDGNYWARIAAPSGADSETYRWQIENK